MGKTRDLFKKIRDTKRILHARMGTIQDRNGKDLTEAEQIRKRWQEYPEKRKCERQGGKEKIYPTECRVPENNKER